MAIPFKTHDVYVLEAPLVTDAHGNRSRTTRDWENATVVAGPEPASVQMNTGSSSSSMGTSQDTAGGRNQTTETKRVRLNSDVPIRTDHGVRLGVSGPIYQVQGEPQHLPDPFGGGLGHIVCKAEFVRG